MTLGNYKVGSYNPVRTDLQLKTASRLLAESEALLAETDRRLTTEIENWKSAKSLGELEVINDEVNNLMGRCIRIAQRIMKYARAYNLDPSAKARAYSEEG